MHSYQTDRWTGPCQCLFFFPHATALLYDGTWTAEQPALREKESSCSDEKDELSLQYLEKRVAQHAKSVTEHDSCRTERGYDLGNEEEGGDTACPQGGAQPTLQYVPGRDCEPSSNR